MTAVWEMRQLRRSLALARRSMCLNIIELCGAVGRIRIAPNRGEWHYFSCSECLNNGYCLLVEPDERQSPDDCDMVRNMRTKFLLLGIAALPLVFGCNSATSGPEVPPPTPPAAAEAIPASPAATAQTNVLDKVEPPAARAVNTKLTPPDSVKLSPAATEVAKMARAGVDSSVLIAYVVNSVNTFQLSADEIVYLNDLGVGPEVVSAMIQHDQQIREASLNGAMAASPATPAPVGSVWSNGQTVSGSDTWQEPATAPATEADTQTTVPPPPAEEQPSEVTVNYFYDSLAPYGTWVDIDGYGRCWRPTVVATTPGWRPYVDNGRWVWTDAGWYWYSDYTWGWAPFHYGRWFCHSNWGWCWVPGTVWGPSWVSWRYNDAYYGWAPLPPAACYYPSYGFTYYGRSCGSSFSFGLTWDCFTFVSYNNFCGRYYNRYCAPRSEAARIYNGSTVINNVIVGNNNTIINQGISPDRIAATTRSEIPRASIRPLTGAQPGRGRNETLAADGSSLAVVQHQVPGGRAPVRVASTSQPAVEPITTPAPTLAASTPTTRGESTRPRGGGGVSLMRGNLSDSGSGGQAATPSTPGAMSAPAAQSASAGTVNNRPNPNSPSRPDVTRKPGALYIRGNPNPPATAQVTPEPSAASPTTSSATPWLNNGSSTFGRAPRAAWQSDAGNGNQSSATSSRPGRSDSPSYANNEGNDANPDSTFNVSRPIQPNRRNPSLANRPNNNFSRPSARSQGNDYGSPGTFNNSPPARSAPNYAPAAAQPPAAAYSPAPVTRIERPTPAPRMSAPAPDSPPPSYAPAPRSSPPAPAPAQRSAPSSPSANNGNSGPTSSRPGR
jgi:hypothetical protein